MRVEETDLPGVFVIEPPAYFDDRGSFMEIWHMERYEEAGISADFVQDNLSFSRRRVLRGMHFQNPRPQAKLVCCLEGEVFDVAVDLRRASPTFGEWEGWHLSGRNRRQIYVPSGFAHGFVTLSDVAHILYKCTDFYYPGGEVTLRWDDPEIGIEWPVESPVLSEKDREGYLLSDLPEERLF